MKVEVKKEALKEFMLTNNLTQQQFCKKCDLTENYISLLLKGIEPSPATRLKIINTMSAINQKKVKFEDVFEITKRGE